jgi:precorrin-4/cobalt-precorrin-4 C11-methyltransferase
MKVWFVGAGPGDPELLTVKAQRLLQSAPCCIWAGSLVNPGLLDLLPEACEIHDSAGMDLDAILSVMCACRDRDVDVVRLHTGDPALYGAIAEQMRRLDAEGIPYEVVPGVSAFQAAAATLQIELTLPEVSQTVILTRTAGRTPMPAGEDLDALAATGATLCIYLSASKLPEICQTLAAHYGAECPAALVYHASWPDEKVIRSTLSDLPGEAGGITRTAVILVGPAVGRIGPESKLYDRHFSHGYREGSA